MLAISFDGRLFTTLQALSDYIVAEYGGWYGVPDNHPQIEVVRALTTVNLLWFTGGEHAGELVEVDSEVAHAIYRVIAKEDEG